jgi:anti-anti-sigma factor
MDVQARRVGDVMVISIVGSIDTLTAPRLLEHLQGIVSRNKTRLVADLSGVDYISSAGLRVFLVAIKQTRGKGGDFFLAAVQPNVQRVLDLSGFSKILRVFENVDSAVEEAGGK